MTEKALARIPLISGNWKMNNTHLEAIQVVRKLCLLLAETEAKATMPMFESRPVQISIHPPFTALRSVQTILESEESDVILGAQNCYKEQKGAFTGEISPIMLEKLNVGLVILGHSERREIFGETDELVREKIDAIMPTSICPIVCVGETLDERQSGGWVSKISGQVEHAVKGLNRKFLPKLVIAYEPIWAIGTGLNASAEDAQEVAKLIRDCIGEIFSAGSSSDLARQVRIQYGGSVKPQTAGIILEQQDIDGLLVGGASLVPEEFAAIVNCARMAPNE